MMSSLAVWLSRIPIKVPAGVLAFIKLPPRLGAKELAPAIAVSTDGFESDSASGGINCAVEVYSFGIKNAMPVASNMPIPVTMASHRRRRQIAATKSVTGISQSNALLSTS